VTALILAFVLGLLLSRVLFVGLHATLSLPMLERENFRGRRLPTAAGIVIVVAVLLLEGARVFAGSIGIGDLVSTPERRLVVLAVLGFGLLGFVDDVLGFGDDRGFGGHLRALREGRLTTGLLKLLAGAALALVLASAAGTRHGQIIIDAALIALAANLANLLDRRPGRTLKYALVCYVAVAILCGTGAVGIAIAPVAGAALALAPDDLRERVMLGDTGANVLGGVLGLAVVLHAGTVTRDVVMVVLLLLNLMSERVSFSSIIDRVPPLAAFDRLGRATEG
jgi:UDP-N-acetylmuramyl pentapeptide phosphotransferase/UDP-N-acetylglucosamine-1-phosphate transferase